MKYSEETIFPSSEEDAKQFHANHFQRLVSDLMGCFGLDRAEAEYIVQGFFIKLWQNGWKKPEGGSILSVLITYTRLRAIDHLRKNGKLVCLDEFTEASQEDETNESMAEVLRVMEEAMPLFDKVQLSYREQIIVIVIRRLLPLPYETDVIYGAMGCLERESYLPNATDRQVKAQISRNLSDLRNKLRKERRKAA